MPRRLILIVTAVVTALVAATTAWAYLWTNDDDEWSADGPVRIPNQHGYVVRYKVGEVFTDGYERIKLSGNKPAILERVELVGPGMDHFEVVGVLLAGPHRRVGAVQVYDGFSAHPPDPIGRQLGKLVPAEGARLAPGRVGSALQIGLKVVKPGLAVRAGVRLYYTVGDERYTAYQPGAIVNCPHEMSDDDCFDAMFEAW